MGHILFSSALINPALAWEFPGCDVIPKLSCVGAQFGLIAGLLCPHPLSAQAPNSSCEHLAGI